MKTFEEKFTAWVDGTLDGHELVEFEQEVAAHPDAAAEKDSMLKLGKLLRAHGSAPTLTNVDFFSLQIRERIAAEQPLARAKGGRTGWFWSLPRLVWAGGVCLLVAGVMFKTLIPSKAHAESPYFAQVVESWPSDPSIWATTVYNPEDNVTVLWLDGLDYLPASYELK